VSEVVEFELGPFLQVRVVRDAHHGTAARREVLLIADPGRPWTLLFAADGGQHDDASVDQVAVVVASKPVELGARAAGAVDGRGADQDEPGRLAQGCGMVVGVKNCVDIEESVVGKAVIIILGLLSWQTVHRC